MPLKLDDSAPARAPARPPRINIFLERARVTSQLPAPVSCRPAYGGPSSSHARGVPAATCRVFVCIDVEMSPANVVCANVYIKIRSTGWRQNPGRALMKGAIMHFSLVTTAGRSSLERTTYGPSRRHDCLLVSGHRARHYRTHFAIYRYATSSGRAGERVQCPAVAAA